MAPNFRCKFNIHRQRCLQKKSLYNLVSISTGMFVTSLNLDKRHFELSTGDAIMNIAVSFSLGFA